MSLSLFLVVVLLLVSVGGVAYWFGRSNRTSEAREGTKPSSGGAGVPQAAPTPPRERARSAPISAYGITSWGYQLQNLDVARAAASPFDLLVVDYAKDGSDDTALTAKEVERLKRKPDGGRRIVLAYLSIGEAESYRSYWQASWKKQKPGWLLGENPEWEENYSVCFWDPGWQQIMCGGDGSRLDRIIDAGFDGVYLDKCDVYEDLRHHFKKVAQSRPDLEADMVHFVSAISAHAKSRKGDFIVVMQNAEGLIEKPELRRVIDGLAKEELVYGVDAPEKKNGKDDFVYSRDALALMKREGKLVLVVEYLNTPAKIQDAAAICAENGFVLYVSHKNRELDRLNFETLVA